MRSTRQVLVWSVVILGIVTNLALCYPSEVESPKPASDGDSFRPFFARTARMLVEDVQAQTEKAKNEEQVPVDDDLKSDEVKDEQVDEISPASDDTLTEDGDSGEEVKSQLAHKLLIILMDGFRYDYVKRDPGLKGLPRIAKNGVRAKEVLPVHPTKSYPNYYSILTGLYAESHGFVDNYIRDRSSGDIFLGSPHPNASHPRWWTQAEPLWVTAEKHKIKTAVYGWDGCQVRTENSKKRPPTTVCEPYDGYPGAKKEIERFRLWLDKIAQDFKDHKYRLAMVYFEGVDYAGHKYGPQSRITKQTVRDLDEALYDLQDLLTKNDLDDEVNVYLVSDHGMISTSKFKQIKLDELVDMNDVELVLGMGSTMQLLAERGKHSQILNRLRQANVKGLNVYDKSTIPERFHLRGHRNLLPIYLTADKGYQIVPPAINSKVYPDGDSDDDGEIELNKGAHGYDHEYVDEMKSTMYAYGPDIRLGVEIDQMEQVDHYNIFCQLLNLEPRPNNGTTELFSKVLFKFKEEEEVATVPEDEEEGEEKNEIKVEDKDGGNEEEEEVNGSVQLGTDYFGRLQTVALLLGVAFVLLQ